MIVELLIDLFSIFTGVISKLLPNWSIPDTFINAFSYLGVYSLKFNAVLPIKAIITVLFIMISFELIIIGIRIITGLLSLLRGGGKLDV